MFLHSTDGFPLIFTRLFSLNFFAKDTFPKNHVIFAGGTLSTGQLKVNGRPMRAVVFDGSGMRLRTERNEQFKNIKDK